MNDVVEHSIQLAIDQNAKLDILYVEQQQITEQYRSSHKADHDKNTDAIIAEVEESSIDYTKHVKQGEPQEVVVNFASDKQIDLIVIGVRGETGLRRILTKNVAEEIIQTSPVPVLAVEFDRGERTHIYMCQNCGSRFETHQDDQQLTMCPYCGEDKLQDHTIG